MDFLAICLFPLALLFSCPNSAIGKPVLTVGAKSENQELDIFNHSFKTLEKGVVYFRHKRAIENQNIAKKAIAEGIVSVVNHSQEKGVVPLRQRRATENQKIAKKAIAEGIVSVVKSKKNNPTDVFKDGVKAMSKSAVKTKAIKKTKGWLIGLVVVLVLMVALALVAVGYCLYKKRN